MNQCNKDLFVVVVVVDPVVVVVVAAAALLPTGKENGYLSFLRFLYSFLNSYFTTFLLF